MEVRPNCNNIIRPSENVNENVKSHEKIQDSSRITISPSVSEEDFFLQSDHSIFRIDLIMIMLMKTLNQADLITSRQVSSSFNWFATYRLRTLPSLVLTFKYDLNTQTFVFSHFKPFRHNILDYPNQDRSNENKSNNLTALTELMSTSWSFPATSFKFTGGSLGNKDIQEFLNCEGHNLRSLSLDAHCTLKGGSTSERLRERYSIHHMDSEKETLRISMLTNLLVHQASSLEHLLLDHCPDQWEGDNLFSAPVEKKDNNVRLDSLKFLTLGKYVPPGVVKGILDAAPNLRRVDCQVGIQHHQNQYQVLLDSNKYHLLHHFDFYPSPQNNALYATKFSSSCNSSRFNFKSLSISLFELEDAALLSTIHRDYNLKPEATKLLNKILQECASRLSHLTLHSSLSVLSWKNLKIPQLPHVKSLTISNLEFHEFLLHHDISNCNFYGIDSPCHYQYCPPPGINFQLKNTFPLLTKVIFHIILLHEASMWKQGYFDNFENVPTVKCLIFSKTFIFPHNFLLHCSRIFKNVEVLEIRAERLEIVRNSRKGLWNFSRLQELSMDINLGGDDNAYPNLDSAMTGISVNAISRIEDWNQLLDSEDYITNLRRYPSMIHLKDFRRMSLRFFDKGENLRENYPLYLTHVAGELAFKKCPLLQVKLTFDINHEGNLKRVLKAMSPILPYAQSSHSY